MGVITTEGVVIYCHSLISGSSICSVASAVADDRLERAAIPRYHSWYNLIPPLDISCHYTGCFVQKMRFWLVHLGFSRAPYRAYRGLAATRSRHSVVVQVFMPNVALKFAAGVLLCHETGGSVP